MSPRLTTALLITLAGTILIVCASHAQAPDTLWTRTFGGGENDFGATVQQTDDGGYIIVGFTQSYGAGGYDVWLVKTDANGNELWSRTYGGASDDFGHNVQRTDDGGYIITGFTGSYGAGGCDVWLIKTDSSGNEEWIRTFGGSGDDKGHRVGLCDDGGYIIGGETVSYGAGGRDFWLIKTDSSGNELWNRTFGGTEADYCHGIQQTDDGGYILAGPTHSSGAGGSDFWLIKTDSSGYEQWSRTFGGAASDNCHSVLQTDDGGYILAGCSWSYGAGGCDYLLIMTDADGNEQWNRTFGGSECDCCYDVQPTGDGGYILAGWSYSYGSGGCDFWAVKTDSSGNEEWNRTVGGSDDDHGQSVQQTYDGGYILAGHTFSFGAGGKDVWLVHLESQFLNVILTPLNHPINIPAGGGTFDFIIEIANNTDSTSIFDAWIDVTLPSGSTFGPIFQRQGISLSAHDTLSREITQRVGPGAPPGEYSYNVYVGILPNEIWSWDSFPFTKEGGNSCINLISPSVEWPISGWYNEIGPDVDLRPTSFSLAPPHPNPFNPVTTISFELRNASFVKLSVYDINGRRVAELVNGMRDAGIHEVTWDAGDLASGVYLYRIQAGEFSACGKMVLMK